MLTNALLVVLTLYTFQIDGAQGIPPLARCPIRIMSAVPIASIEHKTLHGPVHELAIRFDPFGPKIYGYDLVLHGPPSAQSSANADGIQTFHTDGRGEFIAASTMWTGKLERVQWFEFTRIDLGGGTIWQSSDTAKCQFLPSAPRDSTELPGPDPPTR